MSSIPLDTSTESYATVSAEPLLTQFPKELGPKATNLQDQCYVEGDYHTHPHYTWTQALAGLKSQHDYCDWRLGLG